MSLTGSASMTNELQGSVESGGEVRGKLSGLEFIQGKSAYEVAVLNGFKGTEAEWLASLKGKPGKDGQPGRDGVDGKDGTVSFEELTDEQRESLRGEPGKDGQDGAPGEKGDPFTYDDFTPEQLEALRGEPGKDGADGTMRFEDLTDAQKESLRGPEGQRGEDGVGILAIEQASSSSASGGYNTILVRLEDGRTYDFRVRNGVKGEDGQRGQDGQPGRDGYDGEDATINGVNALTLACEAPLKLEQVDDTATLKIEGSVGGSTFYEATIGTNWTEDENAGVKSQTVAINGVTAADNAHVEPRYTGDGTSDGYAAFVEQKNQFFTNITNGYAKTVDGGITFYIFGDAPTVSIPVLVEVK